jgi:hypothetical protein
MTKRIFEWRVGSPEPEREIWSTDEPFFERKAFNSPSTSCEGIYSFRKSVFSVVFPIWQ